MRGRVRALGHLVSAQCRITLVPSPSSRVSPEVTSSLARPPEVSRNVQSSAKRPGRRGKGRKAERGDRWPPHSYLPGHNPLLTKQAPAADQNPKPKSQRWDEPYLSRDLLGRGLPSVGPQSFWLNGAQHTQRSRNL